MPILNVRISEKEKALLAELSKKAGVSTGALVRWMLNQTPLSTAGELLDEMKRRFDDGKLRVRRQCGADDPSARCA